MCQERPQFVKCCYVVAGCELKSIAEVIWDEVGHTQTIKEGPYHIHGLVSMRLLRLKFPQSVSGLKQGCNINLAQNRAVS